MGPVTVGSRELKWEPESLPKVSAASTKADAWSGDLLVYGIFADAFEKKEDKTHTIKSEAVKALDKEYSGLISEFVELNDFAGKPGTSAFARVGGKARLVGVVGLGPADKAKVVPKWGASPFQAAGTAIATGAKTHKAKTAAVTFVDLPALSDADKAAAVGKVTVGALTGGYEATRFKEDAKPSPLASVEVLGLADEAAASAAVSTGTALAAGTMMARYCVEAPANICTPAYLADVAEKIAAIAPERFQLKVLLRPEVEAMKMGLYLGVAEASETGNDLRFIHLTYKPKGQVKRRVGLVGKGLTFDAGGYNLKVGVGIEMMKFDMGGSAAVLGAARALADIQPEGVEVHFIVASCENMVNGKAMRPGDVLTAANGKTVEVNNTDAEGRLTLADALWYAQEHAKVYSVIDIATLTGAMMVSLGQGIAGAFTPSDEMAAKIAAASSETGEKTWRQPLEDSYWEIMKSPIADMKNAGSRYAGAITAGLFLKQYVNTEKVEWAHLDIAGTAWDEKTGGATGYGAALLAQWAINEGK